MFVFRRNVSDELRIYLLLQRHARCRRRRLGGNLAFTRGKNQEVVLQRFSVDRIAADKKKRDSQAGISMIELMMAGAILVITSLGMIGLIIGSIATNNRNKMDSTQSMLSTSILEQINSTFIGSGTSTLIDCAGSTSTRQSRSPGRQAPI